MTTPSEKSDEMNAYLDKMSEMLFGRKRTDSIQKDTCVTCGGPAIEFRNENSSNEYAISGMCQKCQDDFFGAN